MKKYYVYAHLDKNKIVYVGFGFGMRLFNAHSRGKDHIKWLNTQSYKLKFKIFKHFNIMIKAKRFERELIEKYKPKFNKEFNPNYIKPIIDFNHKNRSLNKDQIRNILNEYKLGNVSMRYLASKYNAHLGVIKRILNGQGYRFILNQLEKEK